VLLLSVNLLSCIYSDLTKARRKSSGNGTLPNWQVNETNKDVSLIMEFKAGMSFGEWSIVREEQRTYSVICHTEVCVAILTKEQYQKALESISSKVHATDHRALLILKLGKQEHRTMYACFYISWLPHCILLVDITHAYILF
jgi:hypothetical protein